MPASLDALWPELLVDEAAPRLHKAAHYARRTLGVPDAVALEDNWVALLPRHPVEVDVETFEAAASAARTAGASSSARATSSEATWSGPGRRGVRARAATSTAAPTIDSPHPGRERSSVAAA